MARVIEKERPTKYPNKKLLENDKGVIIVKRKERFQTGIEKTPCDNCGNMHSSKTIYETFKGERVAVCFFCNKKVHNESATNPRFRKDDILNLKNKL